jgi:hypothetical protein
VIFKKKDSTIFYLLQFFVLSWSFGSCWISNRVNNNGVEHHNGNEHGKATCDNFAKFVYFQELSYQDNQPMLFVH